MILKKLIEILKTFDKEELKKFGRFIRSDYFNTNESITALYRALKSYYPEFSDKRLSNEHLFKHVYGSRVYNDKTFRYLMTELLMLAEKFVALSVIESDPSAMNKALVEGLTSRLLFGQASGLLKESDKKLNNDFFISSEYVKNKIDYSHLWHQLIFISNSPEPQLERRTVHGEFITFHSLIDYSHMYGDLYTFAKNYNLTLRENLMQIYLKNIDYTTIIERLESLEKNSSDKNFSAFISSAKIYLCFLMTYINVLDEEHFYKLKDLVEKNSKFIEKEELQNLYIMLMSCCSRKRKKIDDEKYLRNYFEIVKSGLAQGLFAVYKGQYFDAFGYFKFFQTGIILKEYKWAKWFSEKYISQISPEYREDLSYYTQAEILFWDKQHEKSLELLSKLKFNFFRLKVYSRTLKFMIYYDLGYIEEAYSLLNSFSNFIIESKKLTQELKKENTEFINFSKELLRRSEKGGNSSKLAKFRDNVNRSVSLQGKAWFLEKIEELGHKK